MSKWLVDKNGKAHYFICGDRIINKFGENSAWIREGKFYSLDGAQKGWFENDILMDQEGQKLAENIEKDLQYPAIKPRPQKVSSFCGTLNRQENRGWSIYEIRQYIISGPQRD